jgi:trimeric autotransporter adhesin
LGFEAVKHRAERADTAFVRESRSASRVPSGALRSSVLALGLLAVLALTGCRPIRVAGQTAPPTVPGAPAVMKVTAGIRQIVVGLRPPTTNGGSFITGYRATCMSSNGGVTSASAMALSRSRTVSGLSNAKTYRCKVVAKNAAGIGPPSALSAAVTVAGVPGAPARPTVTPGGGQITVAFSAAADDGSPITKYSAICESSDGGTTGTRTGSSSPIVVTGLTNDNAYTCTVTATNAVGTSRPSPDSIVVVPGAVSDAPARPAVLRGNTQITVTFSAPADNGNPITKYTAICESSDGGTPGTRTGSGSPIVVAGLTNGNTYTCTVTATNAVGTSPPSADSIVVVPAAVPSALARPAVLRGNTQITVTFSAPANNGNSITTYATTCTSSDGGTTGTASGYNSPIVVTGLTNGNTYTCTVTATNAVGTSAPSPPSIVVVPAGVPDAPARPIVLSGNTQITVTFSAPANNGTLITNYTTTCVSPDGGIPGTNTATTSSIVVTGLTNGESYTCGATATNAVGTSPPSLDSIVIVPAAVPDAPARPTVVRGNTQITVTFAAPANNGNPINSYATTCTSSDGGTAGTNSSATSPIVVTGLTNGNTYTCTVTATNTVGTSAPSPASIVAVPAAVPDAPARPIVGRGGGQITASFIPPADNGSAITSYTTTCDSSDGGAPGTEFGSTSPLVVTGLTNGSSYTCSATATNAVGTSPPSPDSIVIVPAGVPDAAARPIVLSGDTQITVTFSAPANNGNPITGYATSCTSSDGGAPGANSGSSSPLLVTGLTNGNTYTCTVTATNGVGTSPPSQASITAVPATIPNAPPPPTVTRGNTQITVTFSAPASDGGAPITNYTATCASSDGGAPGTASASASPIAVNGLTNGHTYTCTVTTTNAVGTSGPSAASNSATPATVPNAPSQPTVSGGDSEINVWFGAPSNGGSPIGGYQVTCTSSDGGAPSTTNTGGSPVAVFGLTNSKTYTCKVTATNAVGSSPASPDSDAVVPTSAATLDGQTQVDLLKALAAEDTYFPLGSRYTNTNATLSWIEPSLRWGFSGVAGVNVSLGDAYYAGDNSLVCIQELSASGTTFAIAKVAIGPDAGTYYKVGTCTNVPQVSTIAAWSPWDWSATNAPTFASVSLSPTWVDVSATSATVTVTAHITDDLADVTSAQITVEPIALYQPTRADLQLVSGTPRDGIYQGTLQIAQNAESGQWRVSQLIAYDSASGIADLAPQQIDALVPNIDVVTPNATAPVFESVSLSPTSVNVSASSAAVTVTAHVTDTDNLAQGVSPRIGVRSPSGQRAGVQLVRVSGTAMDGIYKGTLVIPQNAEAGTWTVYQLVAYDDVPNIDDLTPAQINALVSTTIDVTG